MSIVAVGFTPRAASYEACAFEDYFSDFLVQAERGGDAGFDIGEVGCDLCDHHRDVPGGVTAREERVGMDNYFGCAVGNTGG